MTVDKKVTGLLVDFMLLVSPTSQIIPARGLFSRFHVMN